MANYYDANRIATRQKWEEEERDRELARQIEAAARQRNAERTMQEAEEAIHRQASYDLYKKYREDADRSMLSYQPSREDSLTVDKWNQRVQDAEQLEAGLTDEQRRLLERLGDMSGGEYTSGRMRGSRASSIVSGTREELQRQLYDTGMTDDQIRMAGGNRTRTMTEQLEYADDFLKKYDQKDQGYIEMYLEKQNEAELKSAPSGERFGQQSMRNLKEAQAASQEAQEAKKLWMQKSGRTEQEWEEAVENARYLYDYNKNQWEANQINKNLHTGDSRKDFLEGAAYTGASLLTSPFRGYGAIAETLQGTRDPYAPINTYSNRFAGVNFSNAVQGGVVNRLAENGDPNKFDRWDLAGKAYQIGTSIGESAISMGLGGMIGGPIGGQLGRTIANIATLPSFGTNAYASTLQEAQERGLTKEQAVLTAASAGAFEMLTEVYSLDHFWDLAAKKGKKFTRDRIISWLAQSGIEASEEGASEVLNLVADGIINGDRSEFDQNVKRYMSQGMSEAEAKHEASKDWGLQLGESIMGGFISGFVMGGFGTAIGIRADTRGANEMMRHDDFAGISEAMNTNEADYDTSDDLQKNVLQTAREAKDLADKLDAKQKAGEKVTSAEKRKLYRLVTDTMEMASENSEPSIEVPEYERVESIPEEYMQPSNMTGGEMVERMTAAKTADELVDVYREAQRSSDAGAQNFVEQAYKQYKGRMINAGATQAEFDQAEGRLTSREAFLAGAQGVSESNISLTDKTREDYLKGAQQLQETKAKAAVKSSEDIKGITLTGTGDTATITKDGVSIKASEYENANPAVNNLVSKALTQTTQRAAQAYLDNYVEGAPITSYTRAFNTFHDAGALGVQSFDEVLKKNRYMQSMIPKETLQRIYDTGRADLDEMDSKAKGTIVRKGEGIVRDMRTDQSMQIPFLPVLEEVAKREGVTIVVKDDLGDRVNAYFKKSTNEVVLNAKSRRTFGSLLHEGMGEFLEAWNPEAMKDVQDAILEWAVDTYGAEKMNAIARNYQRSYIEQQGETALRSALNEWVNDAVGGLFSTDDGIQSLAEWLSENRTKEQKQTILQKLADWIAKIADGLRRMLEGSSLNEAQRMTARMAAEQAEQLRTKILDAMDVAIANRDAAYQIKDLSTTEALDKAYEGGYTDGDIRHSIDTLAESAGLTFEKDGQRTVFRDETGKEIKHVTADLVRMSPLGALINASIKSEKNPTGITADEAKQQYDFFAGLLNLMIKTQDIDLIWAVSSTIGFQPIESGKRDVKTLERKKTKNAGFTANSDPQYATTIDFTTICRKTQSVIDAMSEIMKREKHGLTEQEVIDIVYNETHKAGEPVPCPVCYVFSRWVGLGRLFDNMWTLQNKFPVGTDLEKVRAEMAELDKKIAETQKELDASGKKASAGAAKTRLKKNLENEINALYKEVAEEYKSLGAMRHTERIMDKTILTKEQRERLELLEKQVDYLENYTWLANVRLSKNYKPVPSDVLFDINAGQTFAEEYPESWKFRTTRGPAMGKAATPYAAEHLGQILRGIGTPGKIKDLGILSQDQYLKSVDGKINAAAGRNLAAARRNAKVQNLLNGQRIQSTSDFRYEYALDYLLAFFELQAAGAKVQMYTKVPESVGMFASVGCEINCSLMPQGRGYDDAGNLLFSDITGMHPDDAFRWMDMYDNVQPIMVGINNQHIRLCMRDDRITFIIPYHASGNNEERYASMMSTVGEQITAGARDNYEPYQLDIIRPDSTEEQTLAREIRKNILTGRYDQAYAKKKYLEMSEREKSIVRNNPFLDNLYQRFYGRTVDGGKTNIDPKYLNEADRASGVDSEAIGAYLKGAPADTIMPFEFWDKTVTIDNARENGQNFIDYCETLGIYPRFSGHTAKGYKAEYDFTNEDGYWKTLPDRRMYNRDGTYHVQQAVNVTNMKSDYLFEHKNQEGIVKKTLENNREKIGIIADKSIERIRAGREQTAAREMSEQESEETAAVMNEGADVAYSVKVEDQETLDFLEGQEYITTYRTFQKIGDGYYAPMNAMENGKLGYKSMLGVWEQATEDPSKVKDGKFPLKAGGHTTSGKSRTTWAAYNPYLHSSNLVFNDQFAGAYDRPNLVVVECRVPVSELTSGYHADQAKDPVGWLEWKSGSVANALKSKGVERKVMLSRWMKPVRELSNAEVAQIYKDTLDGTGIVVPWNVVSPPLREELEKLGVAIDYGYSKQVKASFEDKFPEAKRVYSVNVNAAENDSSGRELTEDASSVRSLSLNVDRPVENRRDLVAVHNLTLEQLEKTLDMGGFPSPSIAIIKAGMGHSLYGDVSVLFRKETIDPKASRANRVYGGDAWTPTFPAIEYKLSEKKLSKVEDKVRSLIPAEILRSSRTGLTLDLDNATNKVNREGNIVEAFAQDDMLRYAYTLDRGIEVEIPKREARLSGSFDNGQIKDIANAFGEAAIREMVDGGSAYYDAHPETAQRIADILNENFEKKHAGRKIFKGKKLYDFISFSKWDSAVRGAAAYFETGIQQEADPYALTDAVNKAIDEDAYKQWLADLFDGVVEKAGIRNATDVFTRSGNRRSWDALHDDYNLENIVKAMNAQEAKGATGFFAQSEIQALATKNFRSVDEIRKSSNQLVTLPEEEYAKIKEGHAERAAAIVEEIYDRGESNSFIARDQAYEAIADALRSAKTVGGIDKVLRQWGGLTIQEDTAQKVYDLAQDIGNMPTGYFEAKPRRAVYTNEIAAVILPDTASQGLLNKLDAAGVRYDTYKAGDEQARNEVLNAHDDVRFQLNVDEDWAIWEEVMNGTADYDDVFLDEGGNERKVNYRQESMRSMFPILEEGAAALANEKVSKTLVRKIASDLRSMYGSTYNLNTFADNLQKIFAYIQQNGVANYEDLLRVLTEVAQPVIDEAQVVVGSREDYDTFRSNLKRYRIKLNAEQKAEVKSAFDTVQNYRNAFGSNAVFRDDGIALDDIWSELCDMSMGMLDYDTSSADQPLALLDAFEALKPTAKNDYGGSNQDMAYDLALQIIERYFEAHHMQELKDKVKAENAKYRKKVQEKYNERLKKYKQQVRQKANDRVQGVRQKANDRIAELKARHRQSVLESKNRRLASEERGKVKTEAKMLMDMILKPSEKTLKYVPDTLKKPVIEFLNAIDFISRRAEANEQAKGYASQEVQSWRERMQALTNVMNQIQNGTSGDESVNVFANVLDPDLANVMQKWIDDNKYASKISDMDQNALHNLKQILRSVRFAIMNANKNYVNTRYQNTDDLARATIMDLYKRQDQKSRGQIGKFWYNLRSVEMLDPFSYFEEMGEAAASVLDGVREGFNIRARDMKQAQEFGRGLLGKIDVSRWTGNKAELKTFRAVEGEIKLVPAQIMSLYCLSQRPQAYNHIMKGGIKANSVKVKGKWTTQGRPVHVTEAQLKAITDSLTPEQKRIADAFQQFMSTESSKWGNRVTQAMYGYDKFTEDHYFPIKTDQNSNAANDQNIENASYRAILNMSAAKQLTPNAMNPIIIDDIFDVFTDHIVQMATYDGMAMPIADAMRWFNYKEVVKMGKGFQHYDTVQQEISRVLGKEGRQYFLNFILDMNGMSKGSDMSLSSAMISNYKGYAIGANLRVVVQQPTAYLRASAVMSPKYLAEALPSVVQAKKLADQLRDKSMIAWWKSQGYFDTSIGQTEKQIITGITTLRDEIRDKSSLLAGLADDLTWGVLYKAVQLEQRDEFKKAGKPAAGQEFEDACLKRFDYVVDHTQVVDSTLHRTQYMRKPDLLAKTQSAFMAEPSKSWNMLHRAAVQTMKESNWKLSNVTPESFRHVARAGTSFIMTALLTSAAAAVMDAFRSDDDDEWQQKWLDAFIDNAVDNIDPMNLLPIIKEASPYFERMMMENIFGHEYTIYSSNTRMDIDGLKNSAEAVAKLYDYAQGNFGSKSPYGALKSEIKAFSQLTGIPAYGLMREFETVYNNLVTELTGWSKLSAKAPGKYDAIYKAIDKGDGLKDAAAKLLADTEKSTVAASITRHYKEQYLASRDPQLYNRLVAAYVAIGYDKEDAKKKIDKWN